LKDIKQNIKFKAYIKLLLFLIKNIIIQQDLTSICFLKKKEMQKQQIKEQRENLGRPGVSSQVIFIFFSKNASGL
jgi:hypothetical protein